MSCPTLRVLVQAPKQRSDPQKSTIDTEGRYFVSHPSPYFEVVTVFIYPRPGTWGHVSYHYCPERKQYMYDTGIGFGLVLYPTD